MQTRNSQVSDFDNGIQSETYNQFCKSHDHIVTYLVRTLEDCFNMNAQYSRVDFQRDKETLIRRFSHEGLSFATKTLPSFFDSILEYLESGNSDYPSFKLKRGRPYPVFLQRLVAPIYEDYTSDTTVTCIKCLYQLCVAFKKLKGPYKPGVLIKQLDEFCDTDQSLPNKDDWSEKDMHVLDIARNIIRQVVEGLNPFDPEQSEDFLPRPGPGATNTPTKKHERYRAHVLYTQLSECFKYDEWFTCHPNYYKGGKIDYSNSLISEHIGEMLTHDTPHLTSRFKFVHKTFGKPRCICIEQLEIQWLQQALRRALYDRIESHPLTKGFVSFTDQSINGLLALQASCRSNAALNRLATIDMSAASDRISRVLVEYLFQDNKELCKALMCLSTRVIELPKDIPYDKRFVLAKKFAPMGSALCFPVMGLVHFALIKALLSVDSPQHVNDIPVWVYGDDIILSSQRTKTVFEELPKFGMKLNKGKSFVNSLFRESCGVHAYNGVVVTPVRYKSILRRPLSVNDLVSALENEGALYKAGFLRTAEFIRSELCSFKEVRGKNLPFVGRKSPILGFIRDDKEVASIEDYFKSFKARCMVGLQRMHYKTRVIASLKSDDCPPICDEEYYLRRQVERLLPFETRTIKELPKGLTIRWEWHPDSCFFNA